MALRYYFDECVDEDVAGALVALGMDVVTATEKGHKGWPDEDHFVWAYQEGRVLYSVDRDFLRLASQYLEIGEPFPGLIYHPLQKRTKRAIIEAFVLLEGVYEAPDMLNHVGLI